MPASTSRAGHALCCVAAGLALGALAGWLLDVPLLYRFASRLPAMVPATCGLVLGLAFARAASQGGTAMRRIGGALTAAVTAALVLVALREAFGGGSTRWFATSDGAPAGALEQVLPAPNTIAALAFLAFGLVAERRGAYRVAAGLAASSALLAVMSLTAITYDTAFWDGAVRRVGMGVPTSLCVSALAMAGLLSAAAVSQSSPNGGFGVLVRRVLPVIVSMPLALGVLREAGIVLGWFDERMGSTLAACCAMLASAAVLVWAARRLDQLESERRASDERAVWAEERMRVLAETAVARRRAFDFAEASATRLRRVVERGPIGIVFSDARGRIRECNPAFRALVGAGTHESLHWSAFRPDRAPREGGGDAMRAASRSSGGLAELVTCDGGSIPVLTSSERVPDPEGGEEIVTFVVDLSAEQRAERERRALIEHLPDVVFRLDRDLRHLFVSGPVERWTGIARERFLGRTGRELGIDGAACDAFEAACRMVLSHGAETSVEWSNGDRHFRSRLIPERDARGGVASLLGITEDVTDAVLDQKKLAESETRAELAREAARLGLHDYDPSRGLLWWDARCREIFGLAPDVPISMDVFWAGVHPADSDAVRAAIDAATDPATGGHYESEYRVLPRDGAPLRWVRATGKVFFAGEAAERVAVRLVGTIEDVTDRKAAADALLEADRRKDEFLAVLAHELRNPLAPLRNAVGMLELGAGDDDLLERVRGILDRQVSHMTRLVDELLDVSRITTGRIALSREPLTPREIVDAAVEIAAPLIEEGRHTLTVRGTETRVHVDGDRTRLVQAIGNLLTNAAKFTPPGGHIDVGIDGDASGVRIRVRDDGIGFGPGGERRIFDLFWQEERSLGRLHGGLGIGLTLARRLVELHGGWLEAASEGAGRGAEFEVRLPAMDSGRRAPASEPGRARTPRRVLVVEDNPDAAESLCMLLEQLGHSVRVAPTGSSGLDAFAAFEPGVGFFDLGLPEIDGFELARRVRERPRGKTCRLVALTCYGLGAHRRAALEAGFDHHVTKPIDRESLAALVDLGARMN